MRDFVSSCEVRVNTIDVSSAVNECSGVDVLSMCGSQYVGRDLNLFVLLSSYNYIANLTYLMGPLHLGGSPL